MAEDVTVLLSLSTSYVTVRLSLPPPQGSSHEGMAQSQAQTLPYSMYPESLTLSQWGPGVGVGMCSRTGFLVDVACKVKAYMSLKVLLYG